MGLGLVGGVGGADFGIQKMSTEFLASMEVKEETRFVILPGRVFQCERGYH